MLTKEQIDELKKAAENLRFVMDVTPDWAEGRRAGMNDDQTEAIAREAYQTIDANIDELIDLAAENDRLKAKLDAVRDIALETGIMSNPTAYIEGIDKIWRLLEPGKECENNEH